jgi:AcrR family transcriptional regulator
MATTAAKPSPRERLLDAADELFYSEGIQSVGIDRVIERAGVAKASLYSCYGSKEALIEAYLKRRHGTRLAQLRSAADAVEDPVEKILAVYDRQAEICAQPGYRGCPFSAASAEAPSGGLIDQETRAFRRDVHDLFHELAIAAGAADADTLAAQLHMIYDGAGNANRIANNEPTAVPARAMVKVVLDAALN